MGDKYWLFMAAVMFTANVPVAGGLLLLAYAFSIKDRRQ